VTDLSGVEERRIQTEGESGFALLIEVGLQDVTIEAKESQFTSWDKRKAILVTSRVS